MAEQRRLTQVELDAPMYGEYHGSRDARDGLPRKDTEAIAALAGRVLRTFPGSTFLTLTIVHSFAEGFARGYELAYDAAMERIREENAKAAQ